MSAMPRRPRVHPCDDPACELLSVKALARMTGKSERFVWSLNASELLPLPIRLGRSVLWRRADIERWIDQRCPTRAEFEAHEERMGAR